LRLSDSPDARMGKLSWLSMLLFRPTAPAAWRRNRQPHNDSARSA
jgi:hypothetical protein